ncbi:MAG TPA: fumarylacetoacetate hydrolase family protein [Acidimicrobiales bacterium]|nr:fumarylacetoacetate hydrolase family protein [Acidimicrobiales bacterium]
MTYLAIEGGIGRLEDDGSVAVLDGDLAGYLADGNHLDALASAPARDRRHPDEVTPAPVLAPGASVWGIGLNYRSKQLATGRSLPKHPALFLKAPAGIARPGEPIRIPATAPDCVDYEGEIAVVVGAPLFEATPATAASAVVAVAAANDVTARDVMKATGVPSLAKSYPGFGQFGSAVVDPEASGGVKGVEVTTRVNGELRQSDRGDGMILPVPDLLSLLSRYVVLRPGDVVLTGTPAGTGDETKTYLAPGDVVDVEVAGLPVLRSTVVDGRHRGERGRDERDSTDR